MSTSAVTQQLSMEDKILMASNQAATVAKIFAPSASAAIDAGVAAEPVFLALAHMISNLFKHHTSK